MKDKYILKMENISKEFPGVKALDNVDFELKVGEVHAIVGENGAGKSTLMKILSGSINKDKGQIIYNDEIIEIKSTHHAIDLGISTIYQENSLIQVLDVEENIFLGKYPIKAGKILWKKVYKNTSDILNNLSINISPKELVSNLSPGKQQLIEIAKALSYKSKIIIMDEPTSSLSEEDTEHLFKIIKKLVLDNISIIYISHRLKEIFGIADRVTILRDGKMIKTLNVKETNEDEIVKYMTGRKIGDMFDKTLKKSTNNVLLSVKNLTKKNIFYNVSFDLMEGEILGLFGLIGSGRTEIIKSILGFIRLDQGVIKLNSEEVKIKNPRDAYKKGFAFVSEDRRSESIIGGMTVKENLTIILLKKFLSKIGLLSYKKEKKFAENLVKQFSIKTPSIEQFAMNLSGGNQQKLAIAKALSTEPKILVLDEPTRGIDVGSKKEIYDLIGNLTKRNLSTIFISSEIPEVIGVCDRVIVIREGKKIKTFKGKEITEKNLLNAALGTHR